MTYFSIASAFLFAALCVAVSADVRAADQIRVVGSSTVFQFSTAAAEEFGNTSPFGTPIIESTGTGGGLKLFCGGVGRRHPDMVNASRRIKQTELDRCRANGVDAVVEVKIGSDGIVFAASKKAAAMQLSLRDIYLALAAQVPAPGTQGGVGNMVDNPYQRWRDVNPALPDQPIQVLGPPPTSGTRDAFNELAIEAGCRDFAGMAALQRTDPSRYRDLCRGVREDGAYVDAGENDNLIVQKLNANELAVGVFGFSFFDQNADVLQAFPVSRDGVSHTVPDVASIADGRYPVSRSLFVYVKKAHVGVVPGIQEFLQELISERASGEFGYLTDRGLIPLSNNERAAYRAAVDGMTPMVLQ